MADIEYLVGTDADDFLDGTDGENDYDGGPGNDTLNGADGVNTIHYRRGDDVDQISFALPRSYQYAQFITQASAALVQLASLDPDAEYTNSYFGNANPGLIDALPGSISGALSALRRSGSVLGTIDVASARAAFNELLEWAGTPNTNVIQMGPGIGVNDLQVHVGRTASYGGQNVPLEFAVALDNEEGMLFGLTGSESVAGSTATPPAIDMVFRFDDGTSITLAELLARPGQGVIGTQNGTEDGDSMSGSLNGDYLFGAGGDDRLDAGAGFDQLFGGSGNDVISGGSGGDTIYGEEGDDVMAAGKDGGMLAGGLGNDVYAYNLGDGGQLISNEDGEDGSGVDTISLGKSIAPSDVAVGVDPTTGNVILTFAGNEQDTIYIAWFDPNNGMSLVPGQQVERVQFFDADGNAHVYDLASLVQAAYPDPTVADPLVSVPLLGPDAIELSEPAAGGEAARLYAMTGTLFSDSNLPPSSTPVTGPTALEEDAAFSWTLPAGTFVDPEGAALAIKATASTGEALPGWLHFDAATGTFSGTPINDDVGTISVKVTATDPGGLSTSQIFDLNVQNVNDAPEATGGMVATTATEDASFSYALPGDTFSDVDAGDSFAYSATMANGSALPSWLQIDAATGTLSGTPLNGDVGDLSVIVTATDSGSATASKTISISVANTNDAPTVAHAVADQTATEDSAFSFALPANTFADVDLGDSMTLSATLANGTALPSWLSFNAATKTFSGTPVNGDVGGMSVRVTATDAAGTSVSDVFALGVTNTNDAPTVASAVADQTATEDSAFSFALPANTFADVDLGDSMTLSATLADGTALPSWLSFNAATKTFSGTPVNGDVGGMSVRVTATDAAGTSVSDVFALGVTNTNDAPTVANAVADQTATEDSAFSFALPANTFADVDLGDSMTLSATLADGTALPSWLSFNAATKTFSGTPVNGDVGGMSVRVTATDAAGTSVSDVFALGVTNTNDAPTVANAVADQTATEDSAFSFALPANTFADVDLGDSMTLSATLADGTALPSWLSFNAATKTFSGTPVNGDVGGMSVRVTATDAAGTSVSDVFALGVTNTNDAPTVANAVADQTATEDSAFSFALPANTFADVDLGDSMTLSATLASGAALPSWLTFNATTRTFTGTPANGDVGTLSIKVTAMDGGNAVVSDAFNVAISNTNDAPTVSNAVADQSGVAGSAYSMVVPTNAFQDVDSGDVLTLSAKLANGSPLPSWLTFNATTRTLSGTPGAAGQWDIQLVATDTSGASVSDMFSLNVSAGQTVGKTINGTSANDTLTGTAGDDTITGGKGKDLLLGGAGNDTLNFSEDAKWGSGSTRTHAVTDERVSIAGKRRGYDVFDGGTGSDTLVGTSGSDAILLDDSSSSTLRSGARIAGVEKIDAGAGDDMVDLSSKKYSLGDIEIDGGSGNDVLWSSGGKDVLRGGSGSDSMDGGAGNDYLEGGSGNDQLDGGAGNDLLQGGSGNDALKDTSGKALFDGGSGDDTLVDGSGYSMLAGGKGNDKLTLGGGYDVIAFNRGDGRDVVTAGRGGQATLSLGGGISYKDLTLSRSGSDLILNIGSNDRITFEKWYEGRRYQAVSKLQVVAEAMPGFNETGSDTLRDDKLETFDFKGLVKAFDTARSHNPGLSKWTMNNAMAQFHLGGSDTEALGGDLAYQYGMNGTLAGIAVNAAQDTVGSSQFGRQAQTLHTQAELKDGLVKLS